MIMVTKRFVGYKLTYIVHDTTKQSYRCDLPIPLDDNFDQFDSLMQAEDAGYHSPCWWCIGQHAKR